MENPEQGGTGVTTRTQGPSGTTIALVIAVCGLAALCVLLARQNRDLKARLAAAQTATPPALPPGTEVEPLTLVDAAGAERKLAFPAARATLLLAVGTGCGYCVETAPIYRDAIAQIESGKVDVVWTLLDASEPAHLAHEAELLGGVGLVFARGARQTWLRRINITPSAILINRDGRVIRMWPGTLSETDARELRLALIDAAG